MSKGRPRSTRTAPLIPYTALIRAAAVWYSTCDVEIVIPRAFSSGALSIASYAVNVAPPLSARTFVIARSEEHTSELQSLMRISYVVFCLQQKSITLLKFDSHNHLLLTTLNHNRQSSTLQSLT